MFSFYLKYYGFEFAKVIKCLVFDTSHGIKLFDYIRNVMLAVAMAMLATMESLADLIYRMIDNFKIQFGLKCDKV